MHGRNQESNEKIHALGIGYIYTFLSNAGCKIYEVHTDPDHHFQILAKKDDDLILVVVRTTHHPDVGTIDQATREQLIKESNELGAIPYFAGLAVTPGEKSTIELESPTDGREYQVTFFTDLKLLDSLELN